MLKSSACRELFGPVDHEENMLILHKESLRLDEEISNKWGFDFPNEKPLNEGYLNWTGVETEVQGIPMAYRMPNLAIGLSAMDYAMFLKNYNIGCLANKRISSMATFMTTQNKSCQTDNLTDLDYSSHRNRNNKRPAQRHITGNKI